MKEPWKKYMKPFKIVGNLYFVGTVPSSVHMIDTGDGLILIDSGYPQLLYLVLESIWELGFDPHNIKCIIHSHGHYDHIGATRALVELTGARTYIGYGDEDYVNGKLELTWAKELGYVYEEAFNADFIMRDGDIIKLGNTEIRCIHTPGHTPGTMSFVFNVIENGLSYNAGMHGGVGMNSMRKGFLDKYGLSYSCRQEFISGLVRLENERVDIFLGNHVGNNNTCGKYRMSIGGAENPFIDSDEWGRFLEKCMTDILEMLKDEAGKRLFP